jgi:hypothetical protein
MNWLLFYVVAALHAVVFVLIGIFGRSWPQRLLLWIVLPLPAVWYCWDYFAIKRQHAEMCSEVAGVRVVVQPERTDRVRLVGRKFAYDAKSILESYYPRAQVIEAVTEERDSRGAPLENYVSYVGKANPKVGSATDKFPTFEPKAVISRSSLDAPTPGVFEISEQESQIPNGTKTETRLTKDGRLYAIHTTLVHWWTGIRYPDALPTWRCPDTNKPIPVEGNGGQSQAARTYPKFAHTQLLNLIFN